MYLLAKTISLISTVYSPPYQYWRREIRKKDLEKFLWTIFYIPHIVIFHNICTSAYFIHILAHYTIYRFCEVNVAAVLSLHIFAASSTTSIYQITSQLLDRLTRFYLICIYIYLSYIWFCYWFLATYMTNWYVFIHWTCIQSITHFSKWLSLSGYERLRLYVVFKFSHS